MNYAAQAPTLTVTSVNVNQHGLPDVLQQPQIGFAASVQCQKPVSYRASIRSVTGVDMYRAKAPQCATPAVTHSAALSMSCASQALAMCAALALVVK